MRFRFRFGSVALAALLLLLCSLPTAAGYLAPGLTFEIVGPVLPSGETTSQSSATDPTTGDQWWTNGQTIWRSNGAGGWDPGISLPVGLSTSILFDSSGRLYVNDFLSGGVFRREGNAWELFASGPEFIRQMQFDAAGNLLAIGNNAGTSQPGLAWGWTPNGELSIFGEFHSGRAFTIDSDGNFVIARIGSDGIDRLDRDGNFSTLFSWPENLDPGGNLNFDAPFSGTFNAIAATPAGNYLVGLNHGTEDGSAYTALFRVDAATGARTLLATDIDDSYPVHLRFEGATLIYTGFGSLHAATGSGDFDAAAPEPGTLVFMLALCWFGRRYALHR